LTAGYRSTGKRVSFNKVAGQRCRVTIEVIEGKIREKGKISIQLKRNMGIDCLFWVKKEGLELLCVQWGRGR
jgi:hypothetical protein